VSRESFRHEISRAFDDMSGSPSPALSARVRSALSEKRQARPGPIWMAGVAAGLIALIIVGVLVASNLNRHLTGGVPAGGPTTSPSAVATATPSASPSSSPSATPPSNLPAFVCGLNTSLSPPPAPLTAYVSDVRTGTHPGYDRITITFTNGLPGSISLKPQNSATFASGGGKGGNVTIVGQAGILVTMSSADEHTAYSGPTDFKTGYAVLAEARQIQDFEGYVQWALGLQHTACYRVFTLTNPTRLVIDIQQ
jgi:hypothetical protein